MKLRYDSDGTILAVGDDSCEWSGPVLQLPESAAPADLLASFALGRYAVRGGKLVERAGPAAGAVALPAWLQAATGGGGTPGGMGGAAGVAEAPTQGGADDSSTGAPGRGRGKRGKR